MKKTSKYLKGGSRMKQRRLQGTAGYGEKYSLILVNLIIPFMGRAEIIVCDTLFEQNPN